MNCSCSTSGLFPVNANKLTVRWVEVTHSYMGQRLILKEVELPDVWQLVSIIPTTPFNTAWNTSDHSRLKFPVAFHNLFLLYFIPKSVCKSLSFFFQAGHSRWAEHTLSGRRKPGDLPDPWSPAWWSSLPNGFRSQTGMCFAYLLFLSPILVNYIVKEHYKSVII